MFSLTTWLLAFVRASGMLLVFPVFSMANIPVQVRVGLGALLAFLVAPTVPGIVLSDGSIWSLVGVLTLEACIGVLMRPPAMSSAKNTMRLTNPNNSPMHASSASTPTRLQMLPSESTTSGTVGATSNASSAPSPTRTGTGMFAIEKTGNTSSIPLARTKARSQGVREIMCVRAAVVTHVTL